MALSNFVKRPKEWIPNIVMGKDYDRRYSNAVIHYESLENLAGFFSRDMPVHRHAQYLQIHYIDHGDVRFHIDDSIYRVAGPTCFFTPPSVPHSFLTPGGATGHVLTVHQSVLWQLLKDGLEREDIENLNRGICLNPAVFDEDQIQRWDRIGALFRDIKEEWANEHPAQSLVLETLFRLLMVQLARLSAVDAERVKSSNIELTFFRAFTDLIEEHYAQHWDLPTYTASLGVSESRLNHICRNIANNSPKKLINDRLAQEVKRLLTFTSLTSKEICFQLGFNDPAYFSRFFKRHTGMTTLEYKKRSERGR